MMKNWSFRRRLVATIALLFTAGAAVLLTVQYFIVHEIVRSEVTITADEIFMPPCNRGETECLFSVATPTPNDQRVGWEMPDVGELWADPDRAPATTSMGFLTQANDAIGQRLLLWSAAVLGVFALLSVGAANWLAQRSLGRVAAITQTARSIDATDRSARLELTGPSDEIKDLADTIDAMLERLDHALSRQEAFLAAASHELRTPMATVHTSLEVPALQGRFPPDVAESVARALKANQKSLILLESLTSLSQIQLTDRVKYQGSLTVALAIALVRLSEEEQPHRVTLSVPSEKLSEVGLPEQIEGDDSLMSIAIENLMRNAITHNGEGGHVWVTVSDDEVTVANTGEEVTDCQIAEFTQPFNRGEHTRLSGGGLGLGLTVVNAIVEHFMATLVLRPRPGGGISASIAR